MDFLQSSGHYNQLIITEPKACPTQAASNLIRRKRQMSILLKNEPGLIKMLTGRTASAHRKLHPQVPAACRLPRTLCVDSSAPRPPLEFV